VTGYYSASKYLLITKGKERLLGQKLGSLYLNPLMKVSIISMGQIEIMYHLPELNEQNTASPL
jgi:hypothetical protein